MKIAYILSTTTPLSGSHIAFKNMLRGVMELGVQPVVVIPDKKELYDDLLPLGVPLFTVKYRFAVYPYLRSFKDVLLFLPRLVGRQIFNWMAVRKLTTYLRSENIDLIHTNVGVMNIGFRTARRLKIPHIYHIREYADLDFGMHHFPSKAAFQRRLSKPDSYSICITKGIQNYFNEQDKPTSRVIYDGVCSQRLSLDIKQKGRYFLYVGRVQPAKGLLPLIEAYSIFHERYKNMIPLEVVGEVSDYQYYEQILQVIKERGIEDMVHFRGEQSDVYSWMQKALAIIIPSLSEGFGFCMPEAMFHGCLAIGHNVGGTKEQMDNGLELQGDEIAFRYDYTRQLAHLLEHVACSSLDDLKPYILRAFDTVNLLYSMEHHADQVYKFYQDILNK